MALQEISVSYHSRFLPYHLGDSGIFLVIPGAYVVLTMSWNLLRYSQLLLSSRSRTSVPIMHFRRHSRKALLNVGLSICTEAW